MTEINVNNIIVSQIASMMKNTLTLCANNIHENFDELKNMEGEDRLNKIFELFGLDKDFTGKLKPKEVKEKETASKPKKEKEIPLPFWGKCDNNCCHAIKAGLLNQCNNKKLDGSNYCKTCSKSLVDGIPKYGTIEMRMNQFKTNKYIYIVNNKPHSIYYKKYLTAFEKRHEDIDCSEENVRKILLQKGYNDEDLDEILFVPENKGKKTGKKNNNDDNDNDDDDAKSVVSDTTYMTMDNNDDDEIGLDNIDISDVTEPETKTTTTKTTATTTTKSVKKTKTTEPKFKLIELTEEYEDGDETKERTIRYAYNANIVTTQDQLDSELYDVYEIDYQNNKNWEVKNANKKYGVMNGETGEIAATEKGIKKLINNNIQKKYLH